MHGVFISYAKQDKAFAQAACLALESVGIPVWIAPRDIAPSVPYASAIVNAITSAPLVLLIYSQHSNASRMVLRELERAATSGKPLLPVRIDESVPCSEMQFYIGREQWLDATTPPIQQHVDALVAAVRYLVQSELTAREQTQESGDPTIAEDQASTQARGRSTPRSGAPKHPSGNKRARAAPQEGPTNLGPSPVQRKMVDGRSPRWPYVIGTIYLLLALGTYGSAFVIWLGSDGKSWVGTFVMSVLTILLIIAQLILLKFPVTTISRRPARRGRLWIPILRACILSFALAAGLVLVLVAMFDRDLKDSTFELTIGVVGALWLGWACVFIHIGRNSSPEVASNFFHRSLLKGSVLELLAALSAHIVVRQRGDCSAEAATGMGIAMGTAVAFIAFGPGVVILYANRSRQLRNPTRGWLPESPPPG